MTSRFKDSPVVPFAQAAPEDALRTMLTTLMHETLEREFATFVGADRFERTPARQDVRNGYRRRRFVTRVGTLTLRIPRDRQGRFQPSLFARYQRHEQAFVLALTEMYLQGVSTRKVSAVVEQLCGTTISASEVSALVRRLDDELVAWRTRPLEAEAYPCLIIDAHEERVRREGMVQSTTALWVIGITEAGYREHLGVWTGPSESEASWHDVAEDLVRRGLHGVKFMVMDAHAGLNTALRRFFPTAIHQRCQVHYLRNALDKVSRAALKTAVLEGLRDVWAAPSRAEADQRVVRLLARLAPDAPALVDWLEETVEDTLAFYALAKPEARRRLRTTNSIEHDHMAVRRRTRVIRIFPNVASLVRLLSALAIERNEQWMARRYLRPTFDELVTEEQAQAA